MSFLTDLTPSVDLAISSARVFSVIDGVKLQISDVRAHTVRLDVISSLNRY